jgi:aminopeptidase
MMNTLYLERWGDLMVRYAVDLKAGQVVRIVADPVAEPLLDMVYRSALQTGAYAMVQGTPECVPEAFYELANDAQLDWPNPVEKLMTDIIDASIALRSSTNLRRMDKVDPKRSQRAARANSANRELFFQRAAAADAPELHPELKPLRWTVTVYPTEAHAQNAGMSYRDYLDFIVFGSQLNQPDPVAFWQSLDDWQCILAKKLMTGKELHYQTPAGTDLKVNVDGARWLSSPGRKNFPDGEVYSGPNLSADNGGVEGVVVFDQRTVYQGHSVRGVRIRMEKGHATEVSAEEGEEFLISMLDQDDGARRIGEVAFGTNRAIQKTTGMVLYDEKMGGSFHMAFGAGFPETGNSNKSALHWDLIASLGPGSRVTLDGEDFCVDGQFVGVPPEVKWILPS